MFFLFSGEGPTDLGSGKGATGICRGDDYAHGPMTVVVDQIVFSRHHYSILTAGICGFVRQGVLTQRASELKAAKKSLALPGAKRAKETRYFFNNARLLSRIALEVENELDDEVVAVFFRDADGTASAGRGQWAEKFQSILNGFEEEGFRRGVPMVPKPKSEAWILCALKYRYQNCDNLEERSGNDRSPNSLKAELDTHSGQRLSGVELVALVEKREVDINRISMPSFDAFRSRLEEVI